MNEPKPVPFVWQVRVYWEDTDGGGVVYHSNYLKFFERARTEWLRARGVHQSALEVTENLVFAIRHMAVDWIAPARLDDLLDISVHSVNASAARLTFTQAMHRAADGVELARAEVTAVSLDAKRFKPKKMPEWIRTEINK
ncbi:tol-pal system-associated acyl-CoA thioesterase [Marinihelvus fidelis]|nr:tol-pal system-associated acyl-CoA thioesterase [Marinihelvus fidelis]